MSNNNNNNNITLISDETYCLDRKYDHDNTNAYVVKLNNQIQHTIINSTIDTDSTIMFISPEEAKITIAGETFVIKIIDKSSDGGVIVSYIIIIFFKPLLITIII